MNKKTLQFGRLLVVIAMILAGFLGCKGGLNGTNPVAGNGLQIHGRLTGAASSRAIFAARATSSTSTGGTAGSLTTKVAALPIVGGALDLSGVQEATVQSDGTFSLDVQPDAGTQEVFLAYHPDGGVGVEKAIGFIELPVGGTSSVGWPLAGAQPGSSIDLGDISGSSGTLLPSSDEQTLLSLLHVNENDLRFEAEHDDLLRLVENQFLNKDAKLQSFENQDFTGNLAGAYNQWMTPSDIVDKSKWIFGFSFNVGLDDPVSYLDIANHTHTVTIVPPGTIYTHFGGPYTPSNPIDGYAYWSTDDALTASPVGLAIFGPPVAGPWTVKLDGTVDGVYNLQTLDPFNASGDFIYFLPSVRLTVDDQTSQILGIELRILSWNPDTNSYDIIDNEKNLGFDFTLGYTSFGENPSGANLAWNLPAKLGQVLTPVDPIYYGDVPGTTRMSWINFYYDIGVPFSFEIRRDQFYTGTPSKPGS